MNLLPQKCNLTLLLNSGERAYTSDTTDYRLYRCNLDPTEDEGEVEIVALFLSDISPFTLDNTLRGPTSILFVIDCTDSYEIVQEDPWGRHLQQIPQGR